MTKMAGSGFRRGEGGQIEAERLSAGRERAEAGWLTFDLVEEGVGLRGEMIVGSGEGERTPFPLGRVDRPRSPTRAMEFDFDAALGRVELHRVLGRRLELIKRKAAENVGVSGVEVDGVLDFHAWQDLVSAVAEHAIGWADNALDPVDSVG